MPVFKQRADLVVRGIKAFFDLEAGVVRNAGAPAAGPAGSKSAGPVGDGAPGADGRIAPGNVVWIFGSGRSGSTWLSSMMGDMGGQTLWGEPWVGTLFGNFYYSSGEGRYQNSQFIMGPHRGAWLRAIRNLVLDTAAAAFPGHKRGDLLVIKEPNGSVGAPLMMEALPESRMVLLTRDPRDVVASSIDARREGGWHFEKNKDRTRKRRPAPAKGSVSFAESRAKGYLEGMGRAKQAYDAHRGPKSLVRYEELRADALGTMRRMYRELGVAVGEEELARVVEGHSWENIPEEERGEGKFYRKATPGGWREDLTPEQAEAVEKVTAPLLRELYPG